MDKVIRKHYTITGEVQGVGFRYTASTIATSLGLKGWVRNEYDGSVSMEVQGTNNEIEKLFEMIERNPHISIEKREGKEISLDNEEREFSIKY